MSILAFYERHYFRLLKTAAVCAACGVLFFAGYVKGSPKSATAPPTAFCSANARAGRMCFAVA